MKKLMLAAVAAVAMSTLPAFAMNIPSTHPGGPNPGNSGSDSCDASLSWLPRVYPQQVLGISEGYRVWITPLCDDFEKLSSDGNGAFLSKYIAKNPVLVTALDGRGYFPADVFAVQMMDNSRTINLFVRERFR